MRTQRDMGAAFLFAWLDDRWLAGAEHNEGDRRWAVALVAPAMPRRLLNEDIASPEMDWLAIVPPCDGLNLVAPPDPKSMRSNLTDLRSFVMLEGVGHWPPLETPDATNAARVAFLQSL
jgi:pimeloyl-ACP methyl ester carboxylesterase